MKAMGIKEETAQDRCAWRNITGGPTRASADAWNTVCVLGSRTLNEYDDDDDDVQLISPGSDSDAWLSWKREIH